MKKSMKQYLYISVGVVSVGMGSVGVVVPGLPTTPFLLLASWLFYRSSPALQQRLLKSWLGRYIRNYERQKGLTPKAKLSAIFLMTTMVTISSVFFIDSTLARIIVLSAGVIGGVVVAFVVPTYKPEV